MQLPLAASIPEVHCHDVSFERHRHKTWGLRHPEVAGFFQLARYLQAVGGRPITEGISHGKEALQMFVSVWATWLDPQQRALLKDNTSGAFIYDHPNGEQAC
eukprot:scaffold196713_cov28-Tisochrysis_lutea.AAC.1